MRNFVLLTAILPLVLTACDGDDDRDGLMNSEEAELGTNPEHYDSDGDKVSDFDEVRTHFTDPLLTDSDGDGFDDGEELTFGSDPLDWMSYERSTEGRWPTNDVHAEGTGTKWDLNSRVTNFTGVDQYGGDFSLEQFYGNVILVDFSAGWCGPCRTVATKAEAAYRAHADDGFLIVHNMIDDNQGGGGVTDPGFLASWADQYGLTFPVVSDPSGSADTSVRQSSLYQGGIPFMVLLDQELKLVDGATGSGSEARLEAKAVELLGL